MNLARVFTTKTSMTPDDADAYIGAPPMSLPKYDEVHISVTFTWDVEKTMLLASLWQHKCQTIKIGGCAYDDRGDNFVPGMYLKRGIIITSRGCPNNCSFCFVPAREGKIRELPIQEGNVIQDNNLLACSRQHIRNVFDMLSRQRAIEFRGGFECDRITDAIVEDLRKLRIKSIWLAFDSAGDEKYLVKATEKLGKYFNQNKLRCYVLIGYGNDTPEKAENRLKRAYELGTLPFAQLYRDKNNSIEYSKQWKNLTRFWSRPAIYRSAFKQKLIYQP